MERPKAVKAKKLHPRNRHLAAYDFDTLVAAVPKLKSFLTKNHSGQPTINFSDRKAVYLLNKALIETEYEIVKWQIPATYLCPAVPSRADYMHYLADLLATGNAGKIPSGKKVKCLDVGTGSSLIYPIIGHLQYGWSWLASDIDEEALKIAAQITEKNPKLKKYVELRLQKKPMQILRDLLRKDEVIDTCVCNPPFHKSKEDAEFQAMRKIKSLKKIPIGEEQLNFSGHDKELYFPGGEVKFINTMIYDSKRFANQCFWFTSLVSKASSIPSLKKSLLRVKAVTVKVVDMQQGNKKSRFIAWTFLNNRARAEWRKKRWGSKV